MAPHPKRNAWMILLLIVLIFSLLSLNVFSSTTTHTSARSTVLFEPRSRTFLAEKQADERLPMASTTKIMTALVALEHGDLDMSVTIPREAVGIEGSSLYLKEGEVFTLRELLFGLMLRSANDAACAIAYAVCGSTEAFVCKMNEKAQAMGLVDTHFDNPHGLDTDTHYTTARELALITAAAMENEVFRTIVSTRSCRIGEGESVRLVTNHNKLLTLYDGAIGVKTGFTKRSGRCLVSAAERDGLMLIAVTIHAPDDWADHMRLHDYGFSVMECRTLADEGSYRYTVPVLGADVTEVTVENTQGFSYTAKKSDAPLDVTVKLTRFAIAPVSRGEILGTVLFSRDGELVCELPLRATEDIAKTPEKKGRIPFFRMLQKG